jgi:hypothetical protein
VLRNDTFFSNNVLLMLAESYAMKNKKELASLEYPNGHAGSKKQKISHRGNGRTTVDIRRCRYGASLRHARGGCAA